MMRSGADTKPKMFWHSPWSVSASAHLEAVKRALAGGREVGHNKCVVSCGVIGACVQSGEAKASGTAGGGGYSAPASLETRLKMRPELKEARAAGVMANTCGAQGEQGMNGLELMAGGEDWCCVPPPPFPPHASTRVACPHAPTRGACPHPASVACPLPPPTATAP